CEDSGIVRAKDRRHRADCSGRAIEASRGPRHSHSPEGLALKLFQNLILANLLVLQQFKTAHHRRRWNIVGEQPRQDFVRAPLLQLRGGYRAALDRVDRSIARGLETGIVDEIETIERPAHASPFVVRQRSRGYVPVLRREDEIGTYLAVRGIGLVTYKGQA